MSLQNNGGDQLLIHPYIYKQSNRVIPSLGREIGNVGTYMQRQNHKCCQSSEYKLQKAFENGV